jgi:hypothetical protein
MPPYLLISAAESVSQRIYLARGKSQLLIIHVPEALRSNVKWTRGIRVHRRVGGLVGGGGGASVVMKK